MQTDISPVTKHCADYFIIAHQSGS